MRPVVLFPLLSLLAACTGDETLSAYGAADKTWVLTEIDGQPFAARATLGFPEPGRLAGQAPCNTYSGEQTAPYPWFEARQILSTKAACKDLQQEQLFLSALSTMTLSEVSGDVLVLSTPEGREMVFKAGG